MTDENYRINPNRLNYLLDQYKLEVSDLASRLTPSNKKRDVFIQQINDVLNDKIKVELKFIKKLDTIFEKGLNWYILNTDIKIEPTKSIFFRKPNIAVESDIIFESKKIVTAFEEKKFELLYLSKLINYNLDRKLNRYTSDKLPINVANEMVNKFAQFSNIKINKATQNKDRDKAYLEYLIRIIEQYNVFVFEFIEAPNKKNPVNYNGFLISPNVIVLKREKSYRREIFTLLHEFAHYLLDLEAIDDVDIEDIKTHSEQEKWCNEFAYHFLMHDNLAEFEKLDFTKDNTQLGTIVSEFYKKTYLSKQAIYTRLKIDHKITLSDYNTAMKAVSDYLEREAAEKKLKNNKNGKGGFPRQEIKSNLLKDIIKYNYFSGNIDENRAMSYLNIKKADKFERAIYS